ncbi:MAG: response regulator [Cellvibrionaceae bacterium]
MQDADKLKVLIVDDSKAMQTILRRTIAELDRNDLALRFADNAHVALDLIQEWRPQLVLCDWHMPEMSGLELLETLNQRMIEVDFGFITTEYSEERLKQATDAGAQFVVTKPFEAKTLHDAIEPLLEKKETGTAEERASKPSAAADAPEDHTLKLPTIGELQRLFNDSCLVPLYVEETSLQVAWARGLPYLVALYTNPSTEKLQAAAILDGKAAGAIPSCMNNLPVAESRNIVMKKQVPNDLLQNCEDTLERLGNMVLDKSTNVHLVLKKVSVVKVLNPAIETILNKPGAQRLDIALRSDQYETGRLTLISA